MKTSADCLVCFMKQTVRVADLTQCKGNKRWRLLQEAAAIIAQMNQAKSPVANARPLYEKIYQISGCKDPYLEIKKQSNLDALRQLPGLRKEAAEAVKQLEMVVRFAIAGNIIDYGALSSFDVFGALERCRTDSLAVDHFPFLEKNLQSLKSGSTVLYLADNCGEIVYDALLVEWLFKQGFEVVIAVKEGPIINDALEQDAISAGLDKYGRIISNGNNCPGTVLDECSDQFLDIFNTADLVIAKGQGNFESLSEVDRDVFFLLTVKCAAAAKHLAELSGVDPVDLPGKGELAVYYSGMIN